MVIHALGPMLIFSVMCMILRRCGFDTTISPHFWLPIHPALSLSPPPLCGLLYPPSSANIPNIFLYLLFQCFLSSQVHFNTWPWWAVFLCRHCPLLLLASSPSSLLFFTLSPLPTPSPFYFCIASSRHFFFWTCSRFSFGCRFISQFFCLLSSPQPTSPTALPFSLFCLLFSI